MEPDAEISIPDAAEVFELDQKIQQLQAERESRAAELDAKRASIQSLRERIADISKQLRDGQSLVNGSKAFFESAAASLPAITSMAQRQTLLLTSAANREFALLWPAAEKLLKGELKSTQTELERLLK
jgi:chromosome segregation ATPase